MAEIRRRWLEAGERFAELGRKFHERVDASDLAGDDSASERLQAAVGEAIQAVDEVLVAAGRVLGDTSLREDAQDAVTSLRDALVVTFTEASAEIESAAERIRIGLREMPTLEEDPASGHA